MPKMFTYPLMLPWICVIWLCLLGLLLFCTREVRAELPDPGPRLLNNDKLLEAIRQTENWDGWSAGAAGERGPWQMLPSTWAQYCNRTMPFSREGWERPLSLMVLREHASWIRDQMEKRHLPQTAYTFALLWKAGYGRVIHNTVRRADKAYAERAQALYEELIK